MNKEQFHRLVILLLDTDEGVSEDVYNLLTDVAHKNNWTEIEDLLTCEVDATNGRFFFK